MTREAINAKGEGRVFADLQEVDRVFRAAKRLCMPRSRFASAKP